MKNSLIWNNYYWHTHGREFKATSGSGASHHGSFRHNCTVGEFTLGISIVFHESCTFFPWVKEYNYFTLASLFFYPFEMVISSHKEHYLVCMCYEDWFFAALTGLVIMLRFKYFLTYMCVITQWKCKILWLVLHKFTFSNFIYYTPFNLLCTYFFTHFSLLLHIIVTIYGCVSQQQIGSCLCEVLETI